MSRRETPIRVVLCRPEGPRNVGSVLRAACNFGPVEIALVAPMRPALLVHPEFEQMSHGVEDAAKRIVVTETLPEALDGCTHAVGFTGKHVRHRRVLPFGSVRDELLERSLDLQQRLALVFGTEQHGMLSEEAAHCQQLVYFETSDEHASLNLSMAVALALHALFEPGDVRERSARFNPLEQRARDFLIENVARTLGDAALNDSARADIEKSVRRMFALAEIEARDARAWHLVMRALGSRRTPGDLDPEPSEPSGRDRGADAGPDPVTNGS